MTSLPYLDGVIPSPGDNCPSILGDGHGGYPIGMSLEGGLEAARDRVPDLNGCRIVMIS